MSGWMSKILRVDLMTGKCTVEPLDPMVAKNYIGGRGLGIYYLNQEVDPKIEPLSPDNLLVMATGPLTGTGAPTGARYMVMTKSPLTGAITCSNSGGMFPTAFKRAGVDAIVFSGRAEAPVYLWFEDGRAELRSAAHLWGKNTHAIGGSHMPGGPAKGMVCHLEEMLDEYYQVQGWTSDGIPTEERLKELGLA